MSHDNAATVPTPDVNYRAVIRLGMWTLAMGFGGFLAFAFLAPLDEGIPATGMVSVESNRKRVEHPNGGIIEQILVREGQPVAKGDPLVVLNETQSKSALEATRSQYHTALAALARLIAERDGAAAISFPPELATATDPQTTEIVRAQTSLFHSRRLGLEGELRIIRESVSGLEAQLESLAALKVGREKQIELFNEQLAALVKLKRDGFVSRTNLLELERQLSEAQSKQSEDLANIASINARLAEFRMRGAQREVEFRSEVEQKLTEMQREAATLSERLTAERDTFERLVVRAPVSGRVVDLAFHTVGGVVKAGDRIMDIVPEGDDLVVEARVGPQYIDRLHVGLPADVYFEAYASRADRPHISGHVAVVSADALADQKTGQAYYAVRVTVPADETQKLGGIKLVPGMLSTVMVKTGERTLATYLARPLLRRFTTALTE